ncbi:MAG: hypothetical protein ACEQSR_12165 [Candidatus Methylacidiphilales bacterium]
MYKNKPTSFKVFIAVTSITGLIFLTATVFSYYQVDKKYSMILAFFMFVALAFTTVGIYAGFKFKTEDRKHRRLNLIGFIGNVIIFVFTLCIMGYAAMSKTTDTKATSKIDSLICKKWKPVAYEEGDNKIGTPEKFQDTKMNFSLDHTVESTNKGNSSVGDWTFDEKLGTITIVDKTTKETTIIKVKNISDKELVLQIGKPEESMLILYMQPDNKNDMSN